MEFDKQNKSGADFPLPRLMEFIGSVTPLNILDFKELTHLVSQTEIAFFPRGQRIISKGDPVYEHLYIIQHGAAKISLVDDHGQEILVDVRGEGDYFGASSLIEGKPPMFNISAQQDLIALMVPAQELKQLVIKYPVFKRYFDTFVSQNHPGGASVCGFSSNLYRSGKGLSIWMFFMSGKKVTDLMSKHLLTCTPDVSVQAAARMMAQRRVGSIVVSGNGLHPLGIVTDNDLRNKVLAAGLSRETAVRKIMSRPVHTISSATNAFNALLSMSHHAVRLLVVIENDRMIGIISEHDLLMETGNSPLQVIGEIERSSSLDTLIGNAFLKSTVFWK